jgi:hypothetical protein
MRILIATMQISSHEPSMNIAFAVRGLTIWGHSREPFNILKTFYKLFELPDKNKGKGYNRVYTILNGKGWTKVGALL